MPTTSDDSSAQSPRNAYYDGRQPIAGILESLSIPLGKPVLVCIGWADAVPDKVTDDLDLLMHRVVAPVCRSESAVVVTGGTDAGVMAALGGAFEDLSPQTVLVGVAPHSKLKHFGASNADPGSASVEPAHRLIRTPGDDWGTEGPSLVKVAETIAADRNLVVLAVGGGKGTRDELLLAARRGWPVVLLTGSGGVSHELAEALPDETTAARLLKQHESSPTAVEHDFLQARADGLIWEIELRSRPQVERALRWRLGHQNLLKEAWSRFALLDESADHRKKPTTALAMTVLLLATGTVLVAVLAGVSARASHASAWASTDLRNTLKALLTALPLLAALILGVVDRRARTGTWIELRAASESLLHEIYRYRAGVDGYGPTTTRDALLTEALARIDSKTQGRSAALHRSHGRASDGWPPPKLADRIPPFDGLLNDLTCFVYDRARVMHQMQFLEKTVHKVERGAMRLAVTIFSAVAASAFLLALSWRWSSLAVGAAVAAGATAALVSWREYSQRDARSEAMRSTCAGLRSAQATWYARPEAKRNTPEELRSYVAEVEEALAAEGSDWERALRQAQKGFFEKQGNR